jgi:glycerol kinase
VIKTSKKYIVAIDQGTTSCRSILFDKNGNIKGTEQKEFKQIFPNNGWVEHDPVEILNTQLQTLTDLIKKQNIDLLEIDSIGITNQRETTVLWNKKTGKPVYNAIVWQDNRTSDFCEKLKSKGLTNKISDKTGLVIDSYFSSTKINWILENCDEAKKTLKDGNLLFGTIDTWLIWNLTKNHLTDVTNASRTQLFNIKTLSWDAELLDIFNVPPEILPQVKESSDDFGKWTYEGEKIPIYGVAGDQQAALFGQNCFEKGMAKNTYGTGCFMLMNTGVNPIKSKNGLLTTIAWSINGQVNYALEGSVFVAGAAIQWLRDSLQIINEASETEGFARTSNNEDVIFVPAFSGLGAPYWKMNVKGGIFGLTRDTNIKDLCKATLQSLVFQTRDVIQSMEKDAGFHINELSVDGGACANNFLMEFQADILNTNVIRPVTIESTAWGAALLAGIKSNFFVHEKVKENRSIDTIFKPNMSSDKRNVWIKKWDKTIEALIAMYDQH